jgi:hypothetical protein
LQIQNVLQLAKEKVGVLAEIVDETLKEHQEKRDAAKVRRRGAPVAVQTGRAIAVLPSQKVQGTDPSLCIGRLSKHPFPQFFLEMMDKAQVSVTGYVS